MKILFVVLFPLEVMQIHKQLLLEEFLHLIQRFQIIF